MSQKNHKIVNPACDPSLWNGSNFNESFSKFQEAIVNFYLASEKFVCTCPEPCFEIGFSETPETRHILAEDVSRQKLFGDLGFKGLWKRREFGRDNDVQCISDPPNRRAPNKTIASRFLIRISQKYEHVYTFVSYNQLMVLGETANFFGLIFGFSVMAIYESLEIAYRVTFMLHRSGKEREGNIRLLLNLLHT